MKNKFYITTPIYYVNDRPHIGHAYTTVVADAYARFWREKLGKENVFFLTGTDEHGTKVAQSAAKAGLEPQAFTDQVSAEYKKVWAELGISYDEFFRTTDPAHKKVVGEFLTDLYNKGHIYKATYKGMYCVGCEKFLSFEDIVNGACVLHPNVPLVEQEEENYFFKLKEFSAQVLEKIEAGGTGAGGGIAVLPVERRNEILGKIKQGINDVSVSRPGVSWGIPLPWDEKHTVYVWVDALINYYSATKIFADKNGASREGFWPPQVHIVGKDILWFHSLIWPGLLLARGLELPEHVVAHGFFTIDGQKMSKSLGNVINPLDLVAEYGVDAARYLIISAFPFGTDGDISLAKFKEKYNADLANGIGNLVARVAKLAEKLPKNPLSAEEIAAQTSAETNGAAAVTNGGANSLSAKITAHFEAHRPDLALQTVIDRVRELDQKIATEQPWKKDVDTAEGLAELTALLKEYSAILLDIGTNLRPFLPTTGQRIVEIFSADTIAKPEKGLFERK